jgi:phage baseplate assembly protein gpV
MKGDRSEVNKGVEVETSIGPEGGDLGSEGQGVDYRHKVVAELGQHHKD